MSKRIGILALCYTLFLLLLFLVSATSGIVYFLLYFSAFAIPVLVALFMTRQDEGQGTKYLSLEKNELKQVIPLVPLAVSAVIAISALTSLLIYLSTGRTNSVDLGNSFILALLRYALLPAVLEEMLFRYLPMRLLLPYSKRATVLISAFFFSLVHHDLFSIPYAFVAGIIFMAVDVATESIVPSVIMHFINNALSVGMIIFKDNSAFAPTAYIILGILSLISLVTVWFGRKEYKKMLATAFEKGEPVGFSAEMLLFAVITLTIAVISFV